MGKVIKQAGLENLAGGMYENYKAATQIMNHSKTIKVFRQKSSVASCS